MLQDIVIIGKHHKESVKDMSKRTSVIGLDKCAICGNGWKTGKLLHTENIVTVITKRNTVVKFYRKCYKKMLKEQREEDN